MLQDNTAYLLVHYKGAEHPLEEQIYFAISKDGYRWKSVNHGNPVIVCDKGEHGARDISIIRTQKQEFVIMANDLSMSQNFQKKYKGDWAQIGKKGSPYIGMWTSKNLLRWSKEQLCYLGNERFGCFWGPEAIYDEVEKNYVVYWSSAHASNDYGNKAIYYATTKDFKVFTTPELMYRKEDASVVDPYIIKVGDTYYRFLKSRSNPFAVVMSKSDSLFGEYKVVEKFSRWMSTYVEKEYEAPILYQLSDGKYCLLLDYFGEDRTYKGYVPFVTTDLEEGSFVEETKLFSFPYGMKHGSVLSITEEEYRGLDNMV